MVAARNQSKEKPHELVNQPKLVEQRTDHACLYGSGSRRRQEYLTSHRQCLAACRWQGLQPSSRCRAFGWARFPTRGVRRGARWQLAFFRARVSGPVDPLKRLSRQPQYSEGSKTVVADRSASVMIQNLVPDSVR